jgi:hypothetical protein
MPVEIYISSAPEDEPLRMKLEKQLRVLERQGLIDTWSSRIINAGRDWVQEISQHINTAQIILLLVSSDFLASDYVYDIEMKRALERHKRGEARVIPIILRPCDWHHDVLRNLPALPTAAKPITTWQYEDDAFLDVVEGIRKTIEELLAAIEFSIEQGDIISFNTDVLALKYAQRFFGTDEIIAHLLNKVGIAIETIRPDVGDYRYIETRNCIQARYALFIGVQDLLDFNYQHIQEFGTRALNILSYRAPETKHLAMTIHGAGFGLDETEAFLAQFRGYIFALQSGHFPEHLEKITIIDRNLERVQRLREAFDENFSNADFVSKLQNKQTYHINIRRLIRNFKGNQLSYGVSEKGRIDSDTKRHVFVAMPFKKDMDDIFYYGIQQPVRSAGFVCERIDQEAFIGDILNQVKKKIETAAVVIAELSGANPNVYLEVGYAWGKGRPTILLMKDDQELRFDVSGQRCLKYERIKDLEESLQKELEELKSQKFI